jgi:hypothetical protein
MRNAIGPALAWGLFAVATWLPGSDVEGQTRRTMTSERQVWSTDPLDVEINYGAGTLRIEPAASPTLYRIELNYVEGSIEPIVDFDEGRRELELGIRTIEGNRRSSLRDGSTAKIALTREVPLDLDLDFGAGKAEIQLGGISLRNLSIATGASETTVSFDRPNPIAAESVRISAGAADLQVIGLGNVRARNIRFEGGVGATVLDFGGAWGQNATASVEMGIGSLTLRLPRDRGIQITRSSFLTSFSTPGLERRGDSYFSSNWDSAANKLTINVSAALGSVDIVWID